MIYVQLFISATPCNETVTDVLSYQLGDIGYDSFVVTDNGLNAYIPHVDFSEEKLNEMFKHLLIDVGVNYEFKILEDKNWNKEWEKKYFKPLIVSNKCLVRSSFHEVGEHYEYEIVIDPKMAFGTGHHQTTYLMLQEILKLNLVGKSILDMGCGTAVLAILASQMGASNTLAIDFDKWAYENAKENALLNNISNVDVKLGEVDLIQNEKFDYIFANINRNVLLNDIQHYAQTLNKGGTIIMSGFYLEDVPFIKLECENNNLSYQKFEQKENWVAMICIKK